MSTSLWDLSLGSFRDQTASAQPTPGGGAACAVSGSLGLGLLLMALQITQRRSDSALAPRIDDAIARARALLPQLSAAADDDVRVFEAYMTAMRLPKQSAAERALRSEALRLASHEASRAPLTAARAVLEALSIGEQAAALASKHVLSDVVAGTELLHAASVGLLATLSMNLRADDESPERLAFDTEREQLAERAARAIEAVRARVKAR